MALLFCGFLLAIGLGLVVLGFLAVALLALGAAVVIAAWPRARRRFGRALPAWYTRGSAARAALTPIWREVRRATVSGAALGRRRVSAFAATTCRSSMRVGRDLAEAGSERTARLASRLTGRDPRREALRLNAEGSDYRRNGRFAEAAECHRRALDILRALDDRRAIALTESNLALALSHAGDDHWAIGLFEEAAATLRELGDEEHEAQIMANLGLAHRRHGRAEEAESMLRLALTKLSPASRAYRTIESELVRVSSQS